MREKPAVEQQPASSDGFLSGSVQCVMLCALLAGWRLRLRLPTDAGRLFGPEATVEGVAGAGDDTAGAGVELRRQALCRIGERLRCRWNSVDPYCFTGRVV
jgi:hypothetical protein